MHVPVHAAQEGGEADGWTDQCGPGAHEVPERMSTGRSQLIGNYLHKCPLYIGHKSLLFKMCPM